MTTQPRSRRELESLLVATFGKYITLEVSEMTHTALNKHLVRHGGRKLTKAIRMASSEIKLNDVKKAFSDLSDIEYLNENGDMVYLNPSPSHYHSPRHLRDR